ncbi:MAG: asparagine synthase (glutamine-hydrolyzing) [Candidatus Marinimicrobia bacterium]|nr:asparagine synthase (glutamine-hydrolyzing) [Candidatus Neomarinimicrobiota bacterium]|tara:strand:+ start:4662 stop:6554 length:1893 start_codon:yes stop_codon:yes gene_type:complete
MCGINGYITHNKQYDVNQAISTMNDFIIHRGPDDCGVFIDKNNNYNLALGMRRLSIIDIDNGKQPMYSKDKKVIIVFNGEIYNYQILRKNLINEGVVFNTNSDTEVILEMYLRYGVSSFSQLDGMFSFSIYDKNLKKLYIARDYFGEKPLYYYNNDNNFFWASELKSIINVIDDKPKISNDGLSIYFQLTYIPAPFTIYEDVYKLEPNYYIEYDCSTSILSKYKIKEMKNKVTLNNRVSFQEAKKTVRNLIMESVKSRSVSDVPIGTFLSGGVDSSIISYCLANYSSEPINTFSIGFDKKSFDETDKSRIVSKLIKSNHHEFIVKENQIKENIDMIILNFDEPFADSSAIPTFLVSKLTKGHVKVVLTGDGGDEVFGGYNKYYIGKINNFYTKIIPNSLHSFIKPIFNNLFKLKHDDRGLLYKIKRLLNAVDYNKDFYYKIISLGFHNSEINKIFNKEYFNNNVLSYYKKDYVSSNKLYHFRNIDKNISLEGDMLVKVDRTSMLNSIECRSPFLNKKIWDFVNSLPDNFLISNWNKKYLLKKAFEDYFPKDFLNKSKQGFGVPVGDWMRGPLKEDLLSYIDQNFLEKQKIFNYKNIREIVLNHINEIDDNTFRVWTFYCFQKWYKEIYLK